MKLLGYIALFLGALILFIDVYLIYISIGFRKKNCHKCKGYLISSTQHKDKYIRTGRFSGRFYKRYLDFAYSYRVDGNQYTVSSGAPGGKENINSVVDVIYQKKQS